MFSDQNLLDRLKEGDKKALEFVYINLYAGLLRYAQKHLGSQEEAEEIVQALFLRIWENRQKINIKSSLKAYLFTSVRNACLNKIKQSLLHERFTQESLHHANHAPVNFAEPILEKEFMQIIESSIEKLSGKCKEVYVMHREQQLTYAEIAEKLNISPKTVEARMSRALQILRNKLSSY